MDSKRIEDIERLLQKMREENTMYRENKQNLYSKPQDNEEEEEYTNLPSRYREAESSKEAKKPEPKEEEEDDSNSDSNSVDDAEAKRRLQKRLEELKSRKKKLGPPQRVKEPKFPELDANSSSSDHKPRAPVTRPTTAKVISSYIPSPSLKKRKNDPVALYQQRQKEWKASSFLRANTLNTREGRKLNLAVSNHAKDFELSKRKDVHAYIRTDYTAPHEKRRDDVRFQTRAKMMSVPDI